MLKSKLSLSFFLIFCLIANLRSQNFPGASSIPSRPNLSSSEDFVAPPDSANVLYLQTQNLEFLPEPVISLDNFQNFNPAWQGDFDKVYLGNIGAASKQLIYQPIIRRGFDLGFHQYDQYFYPRNETRFYNNAYPFSDLFYTASGQEDAIITAKFSQNLNRNSNIALDYRKINQKGSYLDERVRHTNLVASTWLRTKGDRYMAFFSWNNNIMKNQNNGGIQSDTLLDDPRYLNQRDIVPVNLNSAQTEYDHNELSFTHYLQFHKKLVDQEAPDSLETYVPQQEILSDQPGNAKREMDPLRVSNAMVKHQLNYVNMQYKFFDDSPESDSSFYGVFQTNQRGIRQFVRVRKIENVFSTRFELGKEKNAGLLFEPSLIYALYVINHEPEKFTLNDIFAAGTLSINAAKEKLQLKVDGHVGLGENIGDLLIQGKLIANFEKYGGIEAEIIQQRYTPSLIEQRLFISQEEIWNTDFSRTNELNFKFGYHLPKFKFRVGGNYHLIDKYIYFNLDGFPEQASSIVNILQLIVEKDFQLGKIHLQNKLVIQETSGEIRLPLFWSKHSLFFQSLLFDKVMLAKIGFDVRYNTNYKADAYLPVTGQFHLQDDKILKYYPRADFFISSKVKNFRAYLKLENLSQLILQETYQAAPLYPMRDWYIRLGIAWQFLD